MRSGDTLPSEKQLESADDSLRPSLTDLNNA